MEYLPLNTNVIYQNDEGNILHLLRQKGILTNTIIGVNKEINKNIFNEEKMKESILNANTFRAIKNKITQSINIYNNDELKYIAMKKNNKWHIHHYNICKMKFSLIKNHKLPNDVILEYNSDGNFNTFYNTKYRWSKYTHLYVANYTIVNMNHNNIASVKNVIITDNSKNMFEIIKANNTIFKVGYDTPLTDIDSFIIGAIIILES